MQTLSTPQVITGAFAYDGARNVIPNEPTGTYLASIQQGFPPITMQPLDMGGTPPDGRDFNGIFNLITQFYFQFQNGWQPTFSADVSDAIGGYPAGAILWYTPAGSSQMVPVKSLIGNNTYNFNTNPEYIDGVHWTIAWATNFLQFADMGTATSFNTVDFSTPGPAVRLLSIPENTTNVTISVNMPTATNAAWTYELHVKTNGTQIPFISWAANNGTITWLTTSMQQVQNAGNTAIFVFRAQNGQIIANYGGEY
ncbi:MAG: hypothetical protein IKD78_06240 [Bacteroidales bacterium]|nr:hypothetical protein [Bacteroidales bacterium]